MVWYSYPNIEATQSTTGSLVWTRNRNMKGRVEVQLTDVTVTLGSDLCSPWNPWNWAWLEIRLCNSSGGAITNWVRVNKTWGQYSAWVYLGYISPGRNIRLETRVAAGYNSGCPVYNCLWKVNIRYDGTGL